MPTIVPSILRTAVMSARAAGMAVMGLAKMPVVAPAVAACLRARATAFSASRSGETSG